MIPIARTLPHLLPPLLLLLLLLLFPSGNACATTEITVHRSNSDYAGCVLLVIDGLGSSYCYPEATPYALDGSILGSANCTNLLAIAEGGMRVIDVRAPVTSTHPGHSTLVTGCADATPKTVANGRTIFDVAHENGYFCVGVMENGDFKEMCDELDAILHVRKNSIASPGLTIDTNPYSHESVSQNISILMTEWSNLTEYLGDTDGVPRYIAYNRWAIDASNAIVQDLSLNDVPFLMLINVGAVDSAGHHLGASRYLDVIDGTDDAIMRLHQSCVAHDLLFILTADHGMGFATAGAAHGGHVSDKYAERPESQLIPLVFSGSGIVTGTIATGGQEDIAPTILCQMGMGQVMGLPDADADTNIDTFCDGVVLPVTGVDLRVTTGSVADVGVCRSAGAGGERGDVVIARGTSDSEFLFKGLDAGHNYTIQVTGGGRTDEYEIFLDSDCAVDCSAPGTMVASVSVPDVRGRERVRDMRGVEDAQDAGTDEHTSALRIVVPIAVINLVGIFLIVRIMRTG